MTLNESLHLRPTESAEPATPTVRRHHGPPLEGQRVRLRVPTPADYGWLYQLAMSEEVGYRWRFRGTTPSMPVFVDWLGKDCAAQFVVQARNNEQLVGLVQAQAPDYRNGHVRLVVLIAPEFQNQGWPFECVPLFINYVLTLWNFRKIYFEALDFNVDLYRSAVTHLLIEEGRFRDHEYHDGEYVDFVTYALYRSQWEDDIRPHLDNLLGPSDLP